MNTLVGDKVEVYENACIFYSENLESALIYGNAKVTGDTSMSVAVERCRKSLITDKD